MQSWLEEKNWVGKCAQATGMTARLRILSSKADSNTWENFTRCELKLESVHQESPRSDIFRKRATKPLLKQKHRRKHLTWLRRRRTGLLLSGPKSSFQIKVNFAFNLEISVPESGGKAERHRIHVAWSPEWSFHSQWWFGLPCHLLVLVHCVFWSPQSTQPSTRKLTGNRGLHASFSWQALWRCWFHFPAGLATCPHCQRYQKLVQWPRCYCAWLASKLAWPEPHRESIGYCQEEDERHQTQQCRWPEGRYQSSLGFITPEQCHRLTVSMPRRIDAVIHAKGSPPKYWVHRN